jgi:hypothetical protein
MKNHIETDHYYIFIIIFVSCLYSEQLFLSFMIMDGNDHIIVSKQKKTNLFSYVNMGNETFIYWKIDLLVLAIVNCLHSAFPKLTME